MNLHRAASATHPHRRFVTGRGIDALYGGEAWSYCNKDPAQLQPPPRRISRRNIERDVSDRRARIG
ncbi:hypothetical protein ETAE_1418 [Edwardsiella piscicida]|uniref:Uncharacterized protein n=2 Tax=Edwardsiella TaxID=635 RepID=A0A0H3DPV6_EDWTF|nr:hypothetical protein ETAE_1418 [Edwardsiella tarda EIB202]ADM41425.1 hypothetical protein ETAF_1313 [Edwardsiella tarda FL6-60]AGH73451.1 hypothetical protein ETAC_06650 [Edwardsiella piscicida C07-087]ARD17034.1 hypothetical protein BXA22_01045 [Edwardsiella piscicida]QBB11125.1 hypothetical protein EVK84_00355 [Edwardsiella piscicida]